MMVIEMGGDKIINFDPRLTASGGGGNGGGMESRITRLETTIEFIRQDSAAIHADLKDMKKLLENTATKDELQKGLLGVRETFQWTVAIVLGSALAMLGIFIGILTLISR